MPVCWILLEGRLGRYQDLGCKRPDGACHVSLPLISSTLVPLPPIYIHASLVFSPRFASAQLAAIMQLCFVGP